MKDGARRENDLLVSYLKDLCSAFAPNSYDLIMLKNSIFNKFILELDSNAFEQALKRFKMPPPQKESHNQFHQWVTVQMRLLKIKQSEMIRHTGIEQTRLSKLLSGKYKSFKDDEYQRICKYISEVKEPRDS